MFSSKYAANGLFFLILFTIRTDDAFTEVILDICAKLFVNATRGFIERTRKCNGRTDGQTDNGANSNMSPHFMGGDIIVMFVLNSR